jgi:hypothetical protein
MRAAPQLRLSAFATKFDLPWVPRLAQAKLLIDGLSHICVLEQPDNFPQQPFAIEPCPENDIEDVDEGVDREGIDFLGQYSFNEKDETTVTLNICRIRRFANRHGFQFGVRARNGKQSTLRRSRDHSTKKRSRIRLQLVLLGDWTNTDCFVV